MVNQLILWLSLLVESQKIMRRWMDGDLLSNRDFPSIRQK